MKRVGVILYYDDRVRYGLNALAASIDLVEGVDVYLVQKREMLYAVIEHASRKYDACIVGFSLLTTMLVDEDFLNFLRSSVEYARKRNCIAVIGGPHATGDPVGSIASLGFDYAFIGEAECSFREFLVAVRDGLDTRSVKGIFYRDCGKFRFTGKPKPVNLDEHHPFPYWRRLLNPIEITRGCPYGCMYCQVTYMHGPVMRHRSIEKVVEYSEIMARIGVRDIRFISPNSLAYGSRSLGRPEHSVLEELLSKLHSSVVEKHGGRVFFGTFPSEVRPEYVDEESMRILSKYVANREIIVGAQTGSDKLLKAIKRGHTVEDVLNAVDIIHKYGFRASVDFILGLPGENSEDYAETISVVKKLVEKGARIHLHTFMPLPGTPFAREKPVKVPEWVRREVAKLIGMGRAYGEWIQQERIAWKIVELREKGVIMPVIGRS